MKVVRAEILGFCTGVRRAVEAAFKASSAGTAGGVYTLGPLIHNSKVLESLEKRGVVRLAERDVRTVPENAVVIIRAHGIPPGLERELTSRGVTIVDATCPHVKVSQRKAADFARNGFRLFLAGEENHAEIEGIRGYAEDAARACAADDSAVPARLEPACSAVPVCFEPACPAAPACRAVASSGTRRSFVVSNPAEAEKTAAELYRREPEAKTALLGQTTIGPGEYRAIGESIRRFFPSLEIADSICGATADRQNALRELCGKVDAVIIAGSRESANTQRLLSLAKSLGKPAWLAEHETDIPAGIGAYGTVGISAGASAPDSLIDEIEKRLIRIE